MTPDSSDISTPSFAVSAYISSNSQCPSVFILELKVEIISELLYTTSIPSF